MLNIIFTIASAEVVFPSQSNFEAKTVPTTAVGIELSKIKILKSAGENENI